LSLVAESLKQTRGRHRRTDANGEGTASRGVGVVSNVIVVGAGALGVSTAWHAARCGAEVTLVEAGEPGEGATRAGAGLVTRLLAHREDVGLVDRSLHWFEQLDENVDGFEFRATDALLVVGPQHEEHLDRLQRMWRAQAVPVRAVGPSRVNDLPGFEGIDLSADEHAFLVEDDGYADADDALDAMLNCARADGVDLQAQCPVDRVTDGTVHLAGGSSMSADAVVVAAGVHSRGLFDDGWRPPIVPYRAQATRLGLDTEASAICVHDAVNGTYWRPDDAGNLVAGDGTDLSAHDPQEPARADDGFAAELAITVGERWPEWRNARLIESWAGLVAGTPDQRPLVGAVPDRDQVYVCTGTNGFGFMRSPALGEALAGQILDKGSSVPVAGCRPDRFETGYGVGFEPREGFRLV
jgi:glycine/D-amino acid oxidase-like deaminating enzyme